MPKTLGVFPREWEMAVFVFALGTSLTAVNRTPD
jgi:hypothetical protein